MSNPSLGCEVNIWSGDGFLVSSGSKPSPELVLTKISDNICRHYATISWINADISLEMSFTPSLKKVFPNISSCHDWSCLFSPQCVFKSQFTPVLRHQYYMKQHPSTALNKTNYCDEYQITLMLLAIVGDGSAMYRRDKGKRWKQVDGRTIHCFFYNISF